MPQRLRAHFARRWHVEANGHQLVTFMRNSALLFVSTHEIRRRRTLVRLARFACKQKQKKALLITRKQSIMKPHYPRRRRGSAGCAGFPWHRLGSRHPASLSGRGTLCSDRGSKPDPRFVCPFPNCRRISFSTTRRHTACASRGAECFSWVLKASPRPRNPVKSKDECQQSVRALIKEPKH